MDAERIAKELGGVWTEVQIEYNKLIVSDLRRLHIAEFLLNHPSVDHRAEHGGQD
jgi:hypothetical protein